MGSGQRELEQRFLRMLEAHQGGLSRVATSYARTPAERDDLLQDIAFALWKALPQFRGECSERTFLFRIAHNQGQTRSLRRRPEEPPAQEVPDTGESPEAQVGMAQRRERLSRAIRSLPLGLRQVLTLALEDLSHEEIGQVLGLTPNNVAVRLTRACQALREALGDMQ